MCAELSVVPDEVIAQDDVICDVTGGKVASGALFEVLEMSLEGFSNDGLL